MSANFTNTRRIFLLLRADAASFCVLLTLSLSVGLLVNQFRDRPLPLVYEGKEARMLKAVERVAGTASTSSQLGPGTHEAALPEYIGLAAFEQYIQTKAGIVLDARPEIFHRLGHVPGAVSLPRDDFENAYGKLRSQLEADKHQPLVIYCSSASCEDSLLLRKALQGLGYSRISIFKEGWAAWTKAGKEEARHL